MKFKEIPQAIERFAQDQMAAREARLRDPARIASLDRTKQLVGEGFKRACGNGLDAAWKFTLGAPLMSIVEGTKEFGSVVAHNFATKNPKKKRSYQEVPATMIKELLTQYGKGLISTTKLVGNLSIALSRATVLGTRYLIGK
jgi:hypothetical protein